jgi:hypothetical protein
MLNRNENGMYKKSLTQKFKLFFKKKFSNYDFFESKVFLWLLGLNFLANLINWILLLVFISKIDVGIILHYNVYFGVDYVGDWKNALFMPLIGLSLFILNSILAIYFYGQKERIASHILLLTSFMIQLAFIIASFSIIIINY